MKYRREELATCAQQTVELLLTQLAERRLVPVFLEAYVKTNDRKELMESAMRYRELILVLTREALLAMSVRLCADLPRRLMSHQTESSGRSEAAGMEAFREEYFLHLASVMRWTPEELEEFYSDFELYQMVAARNCRPGKGKKAPAKSAPARKEPPGPFADRAALLLDPSLMEKARQAAARFAPELDTLADKSLAAAIRATTKNNL